uniref:CPW-WPC domain-containing protein n=1 Tax=Theileria annulata TaxID=5874 RepID=A0A3B0MGG0_THEAN
MKIILILLIINFVINFEICPEGWNLSYITDICIAPLSYHGPCSTHIITINNTFDKIFLQNFCHINWNKKIICEKDMNKCPKNWIKINNLCYPTSTYKGNCNYGIVLENMESTQKLFWSIKCNTQFNCKMCKKNYEISCPNDWKLIDKNCIASNNYTGPCHTIANLSFFNQSMKEQFEIICNVEFPCKN